MIKLFLQGDLEELREGLAQIKTVLAFEESSDGIPLEIERGDRLFTSYDGEKGKLSYVSRVSFFRLLALFLKNVAKKEAFELHEEQKIEFCSLMMDVSRNGVMSIPRLKEYLKYLALMGLNGFSLYMEDVFEIKEHPYFGYMRGRYTEEELRSLDDFAYALGIEVFPSIEALGHMEQYLKYYDAWSIRDTEKVLLAESEKTYEFLELMIKTAVKPFRSKRIHLAMDETHTVGLGEYLKKFGYKKQIDIFLSHLNRVCEITRRLGLHQDTSADMFFRLVSKTGAYYDKDIVFTQEVKDLVPKDVSLGLWYYRGVNPDGLVDSLMANQKDLSEKASYAGAGWTFHGFLCDQKYSLANAKICLPLAKKHGFDTVGYSLYGDDGTECDYFYALLPAQAYGEHMYNDTVTDAQIKENFEFITGFDYEALLRMSDFHNDFDKMQNPHDLFNRFYGKRLFWQDILLGQMDHYLSQNPLSAHYRSLTDDLAKYGHDDGKWEDYYRFAEYLCDTLSLKCEIAENLQKAYLANNRAYLGSVAKEKLPLLCEKVKRQHALHKKMWHRTYKPFGFEAIDVRYGGLASRIESAIERIEAYLCGELERLEELEAERLRYWVAYANRYERMYTTSSIR